MLKLCVFCGSNLGAQPEYREAAMQLGKRMVERDLELVYGGATVGLMGVLADAVLANGGRVTGVITNQLADKEIAHSELQDLHVVSSMHERKALMETISDGFVALPGGIGTLEETFEILTWAKLGLHSKPCGLLDTLGYYNGLMTFLERMVEEGFLRNLLNEKFVVDQTPEGLLEKISTQMKVAATASDSD